MKIKKDGIYRKKYASLNLYQGDMCLAFMKVDLIKLKCLRHNEKRRFSECNTHSAHWSQEKHGKIVDNLFDKFEQIEGEHVFQRQTSEKFPYPASFLFWQSVGESSDCPGATYEIFHRHTTSTRIQIITKINFKKSFLFFFQTLGIDTFFSPLTES